MFSGEPTGPGGPGIDPAQIKDGFCRMRLGEDNNGPARCGMTGLSAYRLLHIVIERWV
jgi:hypothetical protein